METTVATTAAPAVREIVTALNAVLRQMSEHLAAVYGHPEINSPAWNDREQVEEAYRTLCRERDALLDVAGCSLAETMPARSPIAHTALWGEDVW